ncbi:MAG: site-specific DNA-methyltransferase [Polaromonas sp.]
MTPSDDSLKSLEHLTAPQLRRLLTEHLTKQKLGLYWESSAIARDAALNADIVLPRLVEDAAYSHGLAALGGTGTPNLVIEGDNFDSLRLLKSTHAGKIRVIYIDPPYNTGNKDWVYNDKFVGANDRWRHSQWLEFLYQRLTLAKDLLTPDGVIMVSINDENRARLELLMDEVFPGRRVGSFVWKTRQGSNDAKGAFFSTDHEHVLVYANAEFAFKGFEKTFQTYSNPDNDPKGDWSSDSLSCAKNYLERPNLFYPIKDPTTGIYYPCNPERVWVYASKEKISEGQVLRANTMEECIDAERVIFPTTQRVETWHSIEEIHAAIDTANVPGSGKTLMLRRELPNLEFWIGKPIGFGRPRFKRYKADLQNDTKPLSSWIVPNSEKGLYEADESFISGSNQEGARDILAAFGTKTFHYPKPLSLIQNLLAQASRPGDTILDFFAGSGTTGHAVLALNALEPQQPPRKFILCSSTEATAKEPKKNLCRDVCAARMRKVIESAPALKHNSFAYLQLDKLAPGDAVFDASSAQAFQLLTLRLGQVARPMPATGSGVQVLAQNTDGTLTALCRQLTRTALDALAALPGRYLRVYSTRPATVREHFQTLGREVESLPLSGALLHGQQKARTRRKPATPETPSENVAP